MLINNWLGRKQYRCILGYFIILTAGINNAHAQQQLQTYNAKQIYSSQQCGPLKNPSVTHITNQQQIDKIQQGLRRHLLGHNKQQIKIDFTKHHVLHIHMGQRPTAGYSLSLQNDIVKLKGEELIVNVHWRKPLPDRMYAQIITNPCVLIQIPVLEFKSVHLQDQNGITRLVQTIQ